MLIVPHRTVVAILTAAFAVVAGLSVARAAEDKKEKPLSPETILEKKLLGKVTVEFLVDKVETNDSTVSVFVPGVSTAKSSRRKSWGPKPARSFG